MHHTFLYISLPLLHNYDVNSFNFALYGERQQAEGNFSFLPELGNGAFDKWVGIIAIKTEITKIHYLSEVPVAVASFALKVA